MDIIEYKNEKYNPHRRYDLEYLKMVIREEIDNFISEGLIKTYPLSSVSSFLTKMGYRDNVDYVIYNNDNSFIINYVVDNNVESDYNKIIDKLQLTYGWIHASTTIMVNNNPKLLSNKLDFFDQKYINNVCILNFEPKFDIISFQGDEKAIKFYHVTPTSYVDNILKIGLKPKSNDGEFSYDDRIYLTNNYNNSNFDRLIISMHNIRMKDENKRKIKNPNNYTILEIDFTNYKNINSLKDIQIYRDINYSEGYYVRENIPPNIIKPIHQYVVSGNKLIKK